MWHQYQLNTTETGNTLPPEFVFVGEEKAGLNYALTTDTALNSNKTYYTRSGSEGSYTYTKVDSPVVGNISTYYEPVIKLAAMNETNDTYYLAIRVLFKNLDSDQSIYKNFGTEYNEDGTMPILKRKFFINFGAAQ